MRLYPTFRAQKALVTATFILLVAALFYFFSSVDLPLSKALVSSQLAAKFAKFVPYTFDFPLIIILCGLTVCLFFYKKIKPLGLFFYISTILVGPGLIVNLFFKDQFGRPRPEDVLNGLAPYMPPLSISDYCHHNCSFPCGDASVGFVMYCLRFLFPAHATPIVLLSLFLGSFLGFLRMLYARHFFSDVLFAGLITLLTCHLLNWLILEKGYQFFGAKLTQRKKV